MGDAGNVQPPGRNVRRDQDVDFACPETVHGLLALALGFVGVQRRSRITGPRHFFCDTVRAVLGPGKNQHGINVHIIQQLLQQPGLQMLRYGVEHMGHHAGRRIVSHGESLRRAQCLCSQFFHGGIEGRREEQRLPFGRHRFHDLLDGRQKPHVQHAVRFIDHQDFYTIQSGVSPIQMIQQAARTGDDHLDALLQGLFLRLHAHAAVNRGGSQGRKFPQRIHHVVDLFGQFTRRCDDQGARPAAARLFHSQQVVQNRKHKSGRFAGAGLGRADHITPRQNRRDGGRLDWRCFLIPGRLQPLRNTVVQLETFKTHSLSFLFLFTSG